ncbi:hypothetical protein QYF61_027036, partial [Mycteria americana]
MSICFLYWGGQNWTQHSRPVSPRLSRGEGSPPLTCWQVGYEKKPLEGREIIYTVFLQEDPFTCTSGTQAESRQLQSPAQDRAQASGERTGAVQKQELTAAAQCRVLPPANDAVASAWKAPMHGEQGENLGHQN